MDSIKRINPYTNEPKKVVSWRAIAAGYLSIALILGLFTAALGGILGVRDLRDDYESNYIA